MGETDVRKVSGMAKRMVTRNAQAPKVVVDAANPQPIVKQEVPPPRAASQMNGGGNGYMKRFQTQMDEFNSALRGQNTGGAGKGGLGQAAENLLKNLDVDSLMKDPAIKSSMDTVAKAFGGEGEAGNKNVSRDSITKAVREVSGKLMQSLDLEKLSKEIPELGQLGAKAEDFMKGFGGSKTAATASQDVAAPVAADEKPVGAEYDPKALDDLWSELFGIPKPTPGHKDQKAMNWLDGLWGGQGDKHGKFNYHGGPKHGASKRGQQGKPQEDKEKVNVDYNIFSQDDATDTDMEYLDL